MKKFKWPLLALSILLIAALIIFLFIPSGVTKTDVQKMANTEFDNLFKNTESEDDFILKSVAEQSSVTINEVSEENGKIKADCTISSIDIYTPLVALISEVANDSNMTFSQYKSKAQDAISSAKPFSVKYTLYLEYDKNDELRFADIPYEAYNSYLGGYLDYTMALFQKAGVNS